MEKGKFIRNYLISLLGAIKFNDTNRNLISQVGFIAEESDDLWLIYNIICKGDQIKASTQRKVINESATGSTGAFKVKITLNVSVEKVEYDFESNILKVKGKTVEEHKHVRKGQYHTLDLELNKKFYLTKPVWDSLALSQLSNARDVTRNADVAVVIMQEGLAFLCLLTNNLTVQKAKIEVNIPRKKKNFSSQYQKKMEDFFEQILQALLRHVNFDVIKCVLVASPGFVKDSFLEYMWKQASRNDNFKRLLDNREKFLPAHSSTGFKHSIREVLSDPLIQPKLEDTKAVQEVKIWNTFQDMLSNDPNRAVYGLRDVEIANHYKAISCVMLSDMLFRSNNLALRKKYSCLLYEVKSYGADVRIFSSMHITGQQLNQLTGIAATLKFEVLELTERISGTNKGQTAGDDDDDSDWSSSSDESDSSPDQPDRKAAAVDISLCSDDDDDT